MKTEVLILSAIFIGTMCNGFRDRYMRMKALLRMPGGLGLPMLPPDKRYSTDDLYQELQRISSKQVPLLPPDKRANSAADSDGKSFVTQEKKSIEENPDTPSFSKRLALPSDRRPMSMSFKSRYSQDLPFWRTWSKPRKMLLLPPDKKGLAEMTDTLPDSRPDELESLDSFSEGPGDPFEQPGKKANSDMMYFGKPRWMSRSLRQKKRRMLRQEPVAPAFNEKDKAVVNLIESASEVLHSLAEKLKSYDLDSDFPYDDNDLGKRRPFLPFEGTSNRLPGISKTMVSKIEEELASSRPERSAGLHYKEFQSAGRRKLPLLPFDKREA